MFIVSFYIGGSIQNRPHGVHYLKKSTDNFTVHTDITLAELKTELYH
jgi:hypothetical protein